MSDDPMWTPFYWLIGLVSWAVVYLLFRLRAAGREHIPPGGGLVLAANHTSNFDPWPLGFPLWPKRRLRWMAKSELFTPLLGPVLRRGGAFPVRRGMNDSVAIRTAIETRSPDDRELARSMYSQFRARPMLTPAQAVQLLTDQPENR